MRANGGTSIEVVHTVDPEPFSARIKKITTTGLVTIRFNKEIYELLGDITDETVYVTTAQIQKPWVEVQVTAGEYTEESDLGYNYNVTFKDSYHLEI